jgi:hypothetical protein
VDALLMLTAKDSDYCTEDVGRDQSGMLYAR